MTSIRPDYISAVARVAGPTGQLVWQDGGMLSMVRLGPGHYQFNLLPGTDQSENEINVSLVGTGAGYDAPIASFINDQLIEVRISADGVPFDADFSVEVNRVRTGPTTIPFPPPAPSPGIVPGGPGQPSIVEMDTSVPPPAANSVAVGFQVTDELGNPLAVVALMDYAVFDDNGAFLPAVFATLGSASAGTIVGSFGPSLKVRTDATGKFTCTLSNPMDQTNYLSAAPSYGSRVLDCSEITAVTFTP